MSRGTSYLRVSSNKQALIPGLVDIADQHGHSSNDNARNQRAMSEGHVRHTLRMITRNGCYAANAVFLLTTGRHTGRIGHISGIR